MCVYTTKTKLALFPERAVHVHTAVGRAVVMSCWCGEAAQESTAQSPQYPEGFCAQPENLVSVENYRL